MQRISNIARKLVHTVEQHVSYQNVWTVSTVIGFGSGGIYGNYLYNGECNRFREPKKIQYQIGYIAIGSVIGACTGSFVGLISPIIAGASIIVIPTICFDRAIDYFKANNIETEKNKHKTSS